MGRITSYDENGRLMADFDKDAYGPHWFHKGEWPKSINQNEGVKLAANLRRLEEDNANLRGLVRDMNECLEHCKLVCEYCKFQGVDCQWFKFIERMRELGVKI